MNPMSRDDLDTVLAGLSGADLYRNNAFRVTGLPPGATPGQIRRAREEATLAARLGTSGTSGTPGTPGTPGASTGTGVPPLDPPPGADELRSAFEALRDPVARLAHELLWLWPSDGDRDRAGDGDGAGCCGADLVERHAGAVRAHCAAVEADGSDEQWASGLSGWAEVLEAREFWEHAKARVREIDDPRLTTGTVRRLRERLPRHLASVTAVLAVRAARTDTADSGAATRLVELLRRSPLEEEAVGAALREAVRIDERALLTACAAARDAARADSGAAGAAGRELLVVSDELLRVVEAVCGPGDPVAGALSEEVALALNNCAVAHFDETELCHPALELLERADDRARVRSTVELVTSNLSTVRAAAYLPELRAMCDSGRVERAAAYLRALARRATDPGKARELREQAAGARLLAAPPENLTVSPTEVFGNRLVGRRAPDGQGRFIATDMFTVLWIPLIPIAAYLLDDRRAVYGQVPLSAFARWWRRLFVLGLAAGAGGIVAAVSGDALPFSAASALCAALFFLPAVMRRIRAHRWAGRKVVEL